MFEAIEYLGPVGLGATSPQLFKAKDIESDSGCSIYVVKLANNRIGAKVLVNELIAARFGEIMDLCFPAGGIIHIAAEVLKRSRRLMRAGVQPGFHFASEYLKGTTYVGRHNLFRAVNKEQMAGVILFDHLFYNLDRTHNRKNLIIRREKAGYKIYAIDNSHLFRRGAWTIEGLKELSAGVTINRLRAFGLLLKHCLKPEQFFEYAARVRAISDTQIGLLIDSIPLAWLPDTGEREALKEFIQTRREMAEEIAHRLAGLIPDIYGRPYSD
ncbi:MAG TPA: hypothetical protein PKA28_12950 [Methylomusa anaerophila]|uniref:HipA-like kinase domain-containing protein n=1 Tax=Methylomusa anaerophila TaxID=1930071 RepID=A0A348AGW5_9FIRM|nr:HipA family kinase [Methylomusa anaerophila]BBB90313.1 hypothetical protein MAMMFC1_00961 [Methylomusa anaerophila]HML89341.1 hypothetical protein [Methylomusa anaerophila]